MACDRLHVCRTELEPWEQKHSFPDALDAQTHIHQTLQHTYSCIKMLTPSRIQHTQSITLVIGVQLVGCLFTAETHQLNLALARKLVAVFLQRLHIFRHWIQVFS